MALGAVRYAEPNGDGPPASCPQSDPCDINTAVEAPSVEFNDEIVVLPGDYALGADTLMAAFDINLHGADGQPRPRLSSTADIAVVSRGRIADLEITGSGGTVLQAAGATPLAERVIVRSTGTGGIACLGLGTTNLFRNLVCWASGSNGIAYSTGGTVPRTATLRNVTAVAAGTGIFGYAFIGGNTMIDARNVIARGVSADVGAFTDSTGVSSTITLDNSNYVTESETARTRASRTPERWPTRRMRRCSPTLRPETSTSLQAHPPATQAPRRRA
jgi:hypothetical protein